MSDIPRIAAPRCPGAALYVVWKTAHGAKKYIDDARARGATAYKRSWEAQRAYWHCMTMVSFALERLDEYLVKGFNGPSDQHPVEYVPAVQAERTNCIHDLITGKTNRPVMLGNKTVLVLLQMRDKPEFNIGKTCPVPDTEYRVRTIVARVAVLIEAQRRKA